ncbi:hypothetical protein SAMN02910370_02512 [Lachnospiraceae bacterium XPB1003]|nr:hypothetical protein SAMN02910370_02512 [Lachnospiraceae bacterium XPB1003]
MKCPIIDAHTRIICDENDFAGVREVAEWVRNDLRLVFGDRVSDSGEGTTILVGSLEKSDLLRVRIGLVLLRRNLMDAYETSPI